MHALFVTSTNESAGATEIQKTVSNLSETLDELRSSLKYYERNLLSLTNKDEDLYPIHRNVGILRTKNKIIETLVDKKCTFKFVNKIYPVDMFMMIDRDDDETNAAFERELLKFLRESRGNTTLSKAAVVWCRKDDAQRKERDRSLVTEKELRRRVDAVLRDFKCADDDADADDDERERASDVLVVTHFRAKKERSPTFGFSIIARKYCSEENGRLNIMKFKRPNAIVKKKVVVTADTNALKEGDSRAKARCEMCERCFQSRNAVFRHIEVCDMNPNRKKVIDDEQEDEEDEEDDDGDNKPIIEKLVVGGMPKIEPKERLLEQQERKKRKREDNNTPPPPPPYSKADVWLGGFPRNEFASMRGISELMWEQNLNLKKIQQPKILLIHKKGWKQQDKEWMSWCFLRFRDEEEAKLAISVLDGANCLNGKYRLKANVRSHEKHVELVDVEKRSIEANADPSELKIFGALSNEMREERGDDVEKQKEIAASIENPETYSWQRYKEGREVIDVAGVPVPNQMLQKLQTALENHRWSATSHRPTMESEHYLVLKRYPKEANAFKDPEDETLRACCEEIMLNFAERSFPYDSLAITKNFVASPHIDRDDQSYQFALSLGDFEGGGELIVESRDGTKRFRVLTKNRIAKCDGRSTHWVRGWERGTRYSIIWFTTNSENFTKQTFDVDEGFQPYHNMVQHIPSEDDDLDMWDDEGAMDRPWH